MSNPNLGELFTQVWQKINQMKLHVCLSGEYNVTTLVPTVDYPEENTFYLVPDGSGNNVYTEWIYTNNNWERFGQASIDLSDYVQKTDYATDSTAGVVKVNAGHGVTMDSDGVLQLTTPTTSQLQALSNGWLAPRLNTMHTTIFYGLAKAAGDTTQSISTNAVGLYTDNAKAAIKSMLGIIPDPPSTVGTYTLQAVVANDGITYNWIAET